MTLNRPTSYFLLFLIVFGAAYLRFVNLAGNPGWYTDEGTHLEIAKQLLNGQTRYFAINQSILIFSRPPIFGRLLAFCGSYRGIEMLALRELTAFLGTLSVFLTYVTTQSLFRDRWLSLSAALILAIYPEAVLYSRFGFSYNLLAPLLLLAILGISETHQNNRLLNWGMLLAGAAIGFGILVDLAMISLLPWLVISLLMTRQSWQNTAVGLFFAGLPLAVFIIINLVGNAAPFLFDLNFVQTRLGGRSLFDQLWLAALNFTRLLNQSSWFALGFVGIWFVKDKKSRNLLLLALAMPLFVLGRTAPLTELGFYYIIWILPIIAIGFAGLIRYGLPKIIVAFDQKRWATLIGAIAVLLPLAVSTILTKDRAETVYGTNIDRFLLNADDAIAATDFVNQHASRNSIVIASPGLGWRIDANTADFQMALAAEHIATPHLPADLPQDRFVFDPQFSNADYVIVDNLWLNWGVFHIPQLSQKLESLETWPQVFVAGDIAVYKNPNKN